MAEIKVERRGSVPAWVWALVGLGLIGVVAVIWGFSRGRSDEQKVAQGAAAQGATAAGCSKDDDCSARQLCAGGGCRDIQKGMADCAAAQVHFATDSADVPAGDRGALARMARCLKADQSTKLTISGTTDERGTAEHNMELGEKRAMAVARALSGLGVSAGQLRVVSYGDNLSLCGEADADCWAKNRQASLVAK